MGKEITQIYRDQFVYAPSQLETTLHCNVVSYWLGAYTKWSLQKQIYTSVVGQSYCTSVINYLLIKNQVRI